MDENLQDTANNNLTTTEDVEWVVSKKSKLLIPQHKIQRKRIFKVPFDWLNLIGVLLIPFVVAVIGLYATQQITLQQAQFTQQQNKLSITANERQHQTDLQIASDQQQEATLEAYLDRMSDLLLTNNLLNSKPGDEVRQIARARTLTTLSRLNSDRKGTVLQFLYGARLIIGENGIVSLLDANLSQVNLLAAIFDGINLNGDNLTKAILNEAHLANAQLISTNLINAQLCQADLHAANLHGAYLQFADLSPGLNFFPIDTPLPNNKQIGAPPCGSFASRPILVESHGTDLSGADLSEAILAGADLDQAILMKANLQGANLGQAIVIKANGAPSIYITTLVQANLSGADLTGADLSGTDLRGAKVTELQLARAKSLKGATMPDGSIHP